MVLCGSIEEEILSEHIQIIVSDDYHEYTSLHSRRTSSCFESIRQNHPKNKIKLINLGCDVTKMFRTEFESC